MADYIFQKKGESTWYVKLDIPADVRRALGNRRVFTHTLKTGLRSEAMERRLPWITQWKADIRAARESKAGSGDEWRLAQHTIGLDLQQKRTDAVTKIFTPLSPDATPADISWFEALPEIVNDLRENGRFDLAERVTNNSKRLLEFYEYGGTAGEGIDITNERQMIIGDIEAACIADEYDLSEKEEEEARSIMRDPTTYKPRSPITAPMIEAWAKHLVTQIESGKTRDSHKARIEKISKFLTTEGAPLTFDTIHRFLNAQGGARQTLTNYMWSGRDFWKWAIKYNAQFRDQFKGQLCPFDGHELPKTGKAAGESYIPFTREEVEQLHRMAKEKGKKDLEDLIAFAAYTGARLEEIGRLKPEDTMFDENGEPIGFRITEAKTAAGVREVPLNPALVALYKDRSNSANQNNGYLFKGGTNKNGNRLDGLGKQFGRLKSKAFSRLHVFHSIRKTATTLLHQAGVGIDVIPYIIGHENPSFTFNVYSAGCSFKQKQDAINLLSYSFQ